ncbi:hypothetical protein [Rubritalea tangerina]
MNLCVTELGNIVLVGLLISNYQKGGALLYYLEIRSRYKTVKVIL